MLREHGELRGRKIVQLSNGDVKQWQVYTLLNRMQDAGIVSSRYAEPDAEPPRFRLYKLVPGGGAGQRTAKLGWAT